MKRILLDQNVPRGLVRLLNDYHVETAYRNRWSMLANGDLLDAAQASGFEVFITADQSLEYQQNQTPDALR